MDDITEKQHAANEILSDISGIRLEKTVTPKDILKLGRQILAVLALMFICGGVSAVLWPNSPVFEACRTILPPIATLVIGYYFGRSA